MRHEHCRIVEKAGTDSWALFASFLDNATVLVSPSWVDLSEAMDRQSRKEPTAGNKLQALLPAMDKRQTIWMAALATDDFKKELAGSPDTARLMQSLQHVRGGLTFGDGLQLGLTIQTTDPRSARELRQFVEGLKAILSLAALDHASHAPLLTRLVAAIKIAAVRDRIVVQAVVSQESIEKGLQDSPLP